MLIQSHSDSFKIDLGHLKFRGEFPLKQTFFGDAFIAEGAKALVPFLRILNPFRDFSHVSQTESGSNPMPRWLFFRCCRFQRGVDGPHSLVKWAVGVVGFDH